MTIKNTSTIGNAAQTMVNRLGDAEELVYDPHSGTLEMTKEGKPSSKKRKTMTNNYPDAIGNAAQTMTKRHQEAEELIYNPRSGALEVVKMGKSSTKGGKP